MTHPPDNNSLSRAFEVGTVGAFAVELRKSPGALLEQLREAGVEKASACDLLSSQDKEKLLTYLQALHGSFDRKCITQIDGNGEPQARAKGNSLILVGGLGRFDYDQVDANGRQLLDAYCEMVRNIFDTRMQVLNALFDTRYREACRRMAETLKQLRLLVGRVLQRVGPVGLTGAVERPNGVFFHALKVDGRNQP